MEACIREALKGISERYEIIIDEVGFDQNLICIFYAAAPKMAPLKVISVIKSITARKIFERFTKLKKGELWSDGKYIGTVREVTSEKKIKNYIRKQSLDKRETETRMKQLKLFNL